MIGGMFSSLVKIILQNVRDHFYAAARVASGILVVAGVVLFWAAVSFEGYLLALIAVALAGCSFTGAQELQRNGYLRPTANDPQGLAELTPEDGSSPGSPA